MFRYAEPVVMRCVQVGSRKGSFKTGSCSSTSAGGGPQPQALFVFSDGASWFLLGLASFIVFSVNIFLVSTAVHEKKKKNCRNAKLGLELSRRSHVV